MSSPSPQSSPKIFNCIVDDTALVAGVKRSTRNGLRQWIKNGQIRLFVPLHALEQMGVQKNATSRHAEDVRETLEWLDEATSKFSNSIVLQGGDETFAQWSDVEKFVVPRSLFSEHDHDTLSQADQETEARIIIHSDGSMSPQSTRSIASRALPSPPASLDEPASSVAVANISSQTECDQTVPVWLRPLFNYILWRIHQESDAVAALESFIFLCNDPAKADLAKGFEVRCKRLEQLRDAIAREDREFRNRQTIQHRTTLSSSSVPDETSLSRSPPRAPIAMLKSQTNIIDPDAFERSTKVQPHINQSMRSNTTQRGRGSMRGRGRGMGSPGLGRAGLVVVNRGRADSDADGGAQIDPNSFERPRGGHVGRGGRRLWTPG